MPAGTWDLLIEQGATFSETYTSATDAGAPIDWTGWTARAQIRTAAAVGAELLLDLTTYLTVDEASITIAIPASITTGLIRSGRWDLEMVQGAVVTRLLQGAATISPQVTQ